MAFTYEKKPERLPNHQNKSGGQPPGVITYQGQVWDILQLQRLIGNMAVIELLGANNNSPQESTTTKYQIGASEGGPGTWQSVRNSGKPADITYQLRITGAPRDVEYVVSGTNPAGKVNFDGFRASPNVLLDAKNWTNWPIEKKFSEDRVKEEAIRQIRTTRNGTPIEWHIITREMAGKTSDILKRTNIKGIKVIYTP